MWYRKRLLLLLGEDLPGTSASQRKPWGPRGDSTGLWPLELPSSLPLTCPRPKLQSVEGSWKKFHWGPEALERFRGK